MIGDVEILRPFRTKYKGKYYGDEDRNTYHPNKLPDFLKEDLINKKYLKKVEVKKEVKKQTKKEDK